MRAFIDRCTLRPTSLVDNLKRLIEPGLILIDGSLLLKSQLRSFHADARAQCADETGFECFVNHVHLNDFVATAERAGCVVLEQAFAFGRALASKRTDSKVSESILLIVSGGSDDITIRFHVLRDGQSWLNDDLESYDEPVVAFRLNGNEGEMQFDMERNPERS